MEKSGTGIKESNPLDSIRKSLERRKYFDTLKRCDSLKLTLEEALEECKEIAEFFNSKPDNPESTMLEKDGAMNVKSEDPHGDAIKKYQTRIHSIESMLEQLQIERDAALEALSDEQYKDYLKEASKLIDEKAIKLKNINAQIATQSEGCSQTCNKALQEIQSEDAASVQKPAKIYRNSKPLYTSETLSGAPKERLSDRHKSKPTYDAHSKKVGDIEQQLPIDENKPKQSQEEIRLYAAKPVRDAEDLVGFTQPLQDNLDSMHKKHISTLLYNTPDTLEEGTQDCIQQSRMEGRSNTERSQAYGAGNKRKKIAECKEIPTKQTAAQIQRPLKKAETCNSAAQRRHDGTCILQTMSKALHLLLARPKRTEDLDHDQEHKDPNPTLFYAATPRQKLGLAAYVIIFIAFPSCFALFAVLVLTILDKLPMLTKADVKSKGLAISILSVSIVVGIAAVIAVAIFHFKQGRYNKFSVLITPSALSDQIEALQKMQEALQAIEHRGNIAKQTLGRALIQYLEQEITQSIQQLHTNIEPQDMQKVKEAIQSTKIVNFGIDRDGSDNPGLLLILEVSKKRESYLSKALASTQESHNVSPIETPSSPTPQVEGTCNALNNRRSSMLDTNASITQRDFSKTGYYKVSDSTLLQTLIEAIKKKAEDLKGGPDTSPTLRNPHIDAPTLRSELAHAS